MRPGKSIIAALIMALASSSAMADDWVAERLRGSVMQFQGGQWVELKRGDIVPDGRKIRTASDGRAELVRGAESIALAANTEIFIRDAAGQKMTSVMQAYGTVTIEAERRNVQHFSVQTPVLAAVVKGTQFTVIYSGGRAVVDVDSGVVQVQDNVHGIVADVTPGQTAAAGNAEPLDVEGPGSDRIVFLIDGEVVPAAARDAVISGALSPEDALDALRGGGVVNANAGVNAGGQGNAVSVNARAGNGPDHGSSDNNGHAAGHGHGNANDNRNNSEGRGNGNSARENNADGNGHGNGNSGRDGNGHNGGSGVNAGLDLGVVGVDVSLGAGNGNGNRNGLGLGLDLRLGH